MRAALAMASVLVWQAGAQQSLSKEGGLWTMRDRGVAQGRKALKVVAASRVTVVPARNGKISYTLIRRIAAAHETAARERLGAPRIAIKEAADYCLITSLEPAGARQTELLVEVPGVTSSFYLQTVRGSISVKDIQADVQAMTQGGSVEIDRIRGGVVARTGGGSMTIGRVEGLLRCLSGGGNIRVGKVSGEAVLETAGGEIFVDEVQGTLRVSTAGNIHVGRAGGAVSAHSSGGLIEVEWAGGLVTAESAGGGITIGRAPAVRCESARGTIRLNRVSGSVRASTVSGSIYAGFDGGRALENSFLATGQGDITVFLPSNLAVTVKALNESGGWLTNFASEFAEIHAGYAETGMRRPVLMEGNLNGGGPLLVLSVNNGGIYLKKQK